MNTAGTLVRVVDDDSAICDSLSLFLASFGWTVKAYASGKDFLENDSLSIPGCVILDVRMPEMTGIEVQNELKARESCIPVIFLSAHGDIAMAVRAVQEGAFTFFEKPPVPEKILDAVERAAGKSVLQKREARDREKALALWESLTQAEKQAALLIAKGLRNPEISEALEVTPRTAKAWRAAVYQKLEAVTPIDVADLLRDIQVIR